MRKVIIMSGMSGSGKSTYARKLVDEADRRGEIHDMSEVKVVSADDYFMRNGVYEFDPKLLGDAHGACFRDYIAAISPGVSPYHLVVVDNTNLSAEEIAPYMLGAQAYGWEAEIITLDIPMLFAHQRNVHGVSEKGVENQWVKLSSRKLPPWWKNTVVKAEGWELARQVGQ